MMGLRLNLKQKLSGSRTRAAAGGRGTTAKKQPSDVKTTFTYSHNFLNNAPDPCLRSTAIVNTPEEATDLECHCTLVLLVATASHGVSYTFPKGPLRFIFISAGSRLAALPRHTHILGVTVELVLLQRGPGLDTGLTLFLACSPWANWDSGSLCPHVGTSPKMSWGHQGFTVMVQSQAWWRTPAIPEAQEA